MRIVCSSHGAYARGNGQGSARASCQHEEELERRAYKDGDRLRETQSSAPMTELASAAERAAKSVTIPRMALMVEARLASTVASSGAYSSKTRLISRARW